MSKHTPGPWTKDEYGQLRDANRKFIDVYAVGLCMCSTPNDQAIANARLISAAPDMLEALEALQDGWSKDAITAGSWAKAHAAIAKAKGEA